MKIYITDLAAYNNGTLRGEWVSLPMDSDELETTKAKYGEEIFISDFEGFPFDVKEYSSAQELNTIAEFLDGLEEHALACYKYLRDDGFSHEDAAEKYEEVTFYPDSKLKDVAEQLVDDGCFGEIPTAVANYIDYEAIGRDLRHDGYTETDEGVFCVN